MINKIKKNISDLLNKNVRIIVDIGRNKKERYEGKIIKMYDNIWMFETNNIIKSFSYKDVLIRTVIIKPI